MQIGNNVVHNHSGKAGKVVKIIRTSNPAGNKILVSWSDKKSLPELYSPDKVIDLDKGFCTLEELKAKRYKEDGGSWIMESYLEKTEDDEIEEEKEEDISMKLFD
tara:strand:+ start:94 stop:408 length:315 start_codon:yes stop_codon:yes gene_type:complete